MITFMESKEITKETEKCLGSQLWHACAGSMVQIPPVNSKVFYFPQGHLEHSGNAHFRNCPRFPAYVHCKVSAIKFMADPGTDEVFAKIRLDPITGNEVDLDNDGAIEVNGSLNQDNPMSFGKTLTQSDANNGGGFSVPRYCAETIFPRLDYSVDPPVQTILAKDVHGEVWKFRHIYRGTPRRHLLTTGWSTFVNHKKLVAGDSIVFLRAENGDLCVGIRRAKKGIDGGGNSVMSYGGLSASFGKDESKLTRNSDGNKNVILVKSGRVKAEHVIAAATLAVNGKPFDVIYCPRASTPEFCVKATLVKAALKRRWCSGMRFKMAFETEDSSHISWFMGTISSVQVADPVRWPDSPWRLLQVRWDEHELLQNVKCVNPWQVELVSNMPNIDLSSFSPPQKKLRLLHHPDYPLGQLPLPAFPGNPFLGLSNPFGCPPDNAPAGIQGARHDQNGLSLCDLHLSKLQSDLFPVGFLPIDRASAPTSASVHMTSQPGSNENISCFLTMGSSAQGPKNLDNVKATSFVLFGQQILTEKQIPLSCSNDTVSTLGTGNSSPNCIGDKVGNTSDGSSSVLKSDLSLDTGHCKVFMESEGVGRDLDLSSLGSYEELYKTLTGMFGVEIPGILHNIVYRDTTGTVKQLGEEPFSNFTKTARRLRVVADSSSDSVGV